VLALIPGRDRPQVAEMSLQSAPEWAVAQVPQLVLWLVLEPAHVATLN